MNALDFSLPLPYHRAVRTLVPLLLAAFLATPPVLGCTGAREACATASSSARADAGCCGGASGCCCAAKHPKPDSRLPVSDAATPSHAEPMAELAPASDHADTVDTVASSGTVAVTVPADSAGSAAFISNCTFRC